MVVQGAVNPDEFYVYKPTLRAGKPAILRRTLGSKQIRMVYSDAAGRARAQRGHAAELRSNASRSPMPTCEELARQALVIEQHYGRPMDIEWAKDGVTGKLYIVQARPETVKSRGHATQIERYHAAGSAARCWSKVAPSATRSAPARARVVRTHRRHEPVPARRRAGRRHDRSRLGADHEARRRRSSPTAAAAPAMRRSSPANWACRRWSAAATPLDRIADGAEVTISCAEGDTGFIYDGLLPFETHHHRPGQHAAGAAQDHDERRQPRARLRFRAAAATPGIGLARLEFIIARQIGVHPKALLEYDQQPARHQGADRRS